MASGSKVPYEVQYLRFGREFEFPFHQTSPNAGWRTYGRLTHICIYDGGTAMAGQG